MNAHNSTRRLSAERLEDRFALAGDTFGYTYPAATGYYSPVMYADSYDVGSPDNRFPGPTQTPTFSYPTSPQEGWKYLF